MTKFKVGDRVRVITAASRVSGKVGLITGVAYGEPYPLDVLIPAGEHTHTYVLDESEVERVTK